MAVTIIDAPCGAGKTEYAIAYMNAHPENSFIFITPYLKEIERIKQGTKVAFYDPKNYQRPDLLGGDFRLKSKLDDFNKRIFIKLPIRDELFFTAYDPELFQILCSPELSGWYIQTQKRKTKTAFRLYCRVEGQIVSLAEIVALWN